MKCNNCPRKCNIDRAKTVGFCGESEKIRISRAALHFWEEPCISGERGSGAVFFSGCSLACVFCQNAIISKQHRGKEVSAKRLKEIFAELVSKGAHNINLVTPTHFEEQLLPLLDGIDVPVVWNSSAYEKKEQIEKLKGKVQIFLPDFKYSIPQTAKKYSQSEDYPEVAKTAIKTMFALTGPYKIKDGIMQSGVIIRHLILPGCLENTFGVIDWVADNFEKGDVKFSPMSQYTPANGVRIDSLSRRITKAEYISARNYMIKRGICDGFVQELSSAKEEYTPAFDFTGV